MTAFGFNPNRSLEPELIADGERDCQDEMEKPVCRDDRPGIECAHFLSGTMSCSASTVSPRVQPSFITMNIVSSPAMVPNI